MLVDPPLPEKVHGDLKRCRAFSNKYRRIDLREVIQDLRLK
jgi:hypothetical protein